MLLVAVAAVAVLAASVVTNAGTRAATSAAADYPERPITIVSAFAPGATNDFLSRIVAKGIAETLHGNVIVDNRPGANGITGTGYVARANPDGYTLLMGNGASHGINPTFYPDLPYDAIKDFQGVSLVASAPIILAVSRSLPVDNVEQLIAYGAAHPGKLSFASSGIGSTGHLAGEAFILASKIDMVHVPYKGDALVVPDLMSGQIPAGFIALSAATQVIQAGKLKVIAIASKQRLPSLPDVPTLTEAGYPNMVFSTWYGIVAPAATPPAIVARLNGAIKGVLESDTAKASFAAQGVQPIYTTPEQTQAFIKSEIERFGVVLRALKLTAH